MPIIENPYAIIAIFAFSFVLLATIGVCFAIKGIKTAEGHTENDFVSISKVEKDLKFLKNIPVIDVLCMLMCHRISPRI